MTFQIGESNIHFLVPCQSGGSLKKTALLIKSQGYPAPPCFKIEWGRRKANILKLREYSQIRSQGFGLAAGLDDLCRVFALIVTK